MERPSILRAALLCRARSKIGTSHRKTREKERASGVDQMSLGRKPSLWRLSDVRATTRSDNPGDFSPKLRTRPRVVSPDPTN